MESINLNRHPVYWVKCLMASSFILFLSPSFSRSASAMSTLEKMSIGGFRVLNTKSVVFYDRKKKYYLMSQKEFSLSPLSPNYTVLVAPYPTLFAHYLKGKKIRCKKLKLHCSNGIAIGDSVEKVRRKLGKNPQVNDRILLWNRYHNILSYRKNIIYKRRAVILIQEYAISRGKVEGILFGVYS